MLSFSEVKEISVSCSVLKKAGWAGDTHGDGALWPVPLLDLSTAQKAIRGNFGGAQCHVFLIIVRAVVKREKPHPLVSSAINGLWAVSHTRGEQLSTVFKTQDLTLNQAAQNCLFTQDQASSEVLLY